MSFDFSGDVRVEDGPRKNGHPLRFVFSRLGWRLLFVALFITAVAYGLYTMTFSVATNHFPVS